MATKATVIADEFLRCGKTLVFIFAQDGKETTLPNTAHVPVELVDVFKGHGESPTRGRGRGVDCLTYPYHSPVREFHGLVIKDRNPADSLLPDRRGDRCLP